MSIDAKRINSTGTVSTVTLTTDDPSEVDILDALGGKGNLVTLGRIGPWEILKTSEPNSDTLVIGAAPYIDAHPKRRTSCTLDDQKIKGLNALVNSGWLFLGLGA